MMAISVCLFVICILRLDENILHMQLFNVSLQITCKLPKITKMAHYGDLIYNKIYGSDPLISTHFAITALLMVNGLLGYEAKKYQVT